MTDREKSPIFKFFPDKVVVDKRNKRFESEFIVILPFIEEDLLIKAESEVNKEEFSEDEKSRNRECKNLLFISPSSSSENINNKTIKIEEFDLPSGNTTIPSQDIFRPLPVPGTKLPGRKGSRIEYPSFNFINEEIGQVLTYPEMKRNRKGRSDKSNSFLHMDCRGFDREIEVGDRVFVPFPYPMEGIVEEVTDISKASDGEKTFFFRKLGPQLNTRFKIVLGGWKGCGNMQYAKIRIFENSYRLNYLDQKNLNPKDGVFVERSLSCMSYKFPTPLVFKIFDQKEEEEEKKKEKEETEGEEEEEEEEEEDKIWDEDDKNNNNNNNNSNNELKKVKNQKEDGCDNDFWEDSEENNNNNNNEKKKDDNNKMMRKIEGKNKDFVIDRSSIEMSYKKKEINLEKLSVGTEVVSLRGKRFGCIGTIKSMDYDRKEFIVEYSREKNSVIHPKYFAPPSCPPSIFKNLVYITFDGGPIFVGKGTGYIPNRSVDHDYKDKIIKEMQDEHKGLGFANTRNRALFWLLGRVLVSSDIDRSSDEVRIRSSNIIKNNERKVSSYYRKDYKIGLGIYDRLMTLKMNGFVDCFTQPLKPYFSRNCWRWAMNKRALLLLLEFKEKFPEIFEFTGKKVSYTNTVSYSELPTPSEIFPNLGEVEAKERIQEAEDWLKIKYPNPIDFPLIPSEYSYLTDEECKDLENYVFERIEKIVKDKDEVIDEEKVSFSESASLFDFNQDAFPQCWDFSKFLELGNVVMVVKENCNDLRLGSVGICTGLFGDNLRVLFFKNESNKFFSKEELICRNWVMDLSNCCQIQENSDIISVQWKNYLEEKYSK